jgi:hypothetical protein
MNNLFYHVKLANFLSSVIELPEYNYPTNIMMSLIIKVTSDIMLSSAFIFNLNNIFIFLQTWRDLKSKISEKVQKLRKGRAATGNNPVNITLSDLDKRILGIIGHDYVQGLRSVPDSFPEEHEVSKKCKIDSLF